MCCRLTISPVDTNCLISQLISDSKHRSLQQILTKETVEWLIKGGRLWPRWMPGLRQLRAPAADRRSASLTGSMSAERSRSLKTTTLVAWQLSAGSESAALCFLLFAGPVNLRERGQRQTEDVWAEVKWHFQRFGFLAWKAIKKWNRSSSERLWDTRAPKHVSL